MQAKLKKNREQIRLIQALVKSLFISKKIKNTIILALNSYLHIAENID